MSKDVYVGQVIECNDADEMVSIMSSLIQYYNIHTDCKYELENRRGFFLIVTKI